MDPVWAHPAMSLAIFLKSHKELQTHCLLHPSRPPRPPSWLPSVPQEGHQLVRKAACSGVVTVSKGQLPFLILQGDESSQCPTSHWGKAAALPMASLCHVFLVLSKELSRHESRACFARLRADSIWKPSVCPGTRSTTEQHCPSATGLHKKLPATVILRKIGGFLHETKHIQTVE